MTGYFRMSQGRLWRRAGAVALGAAALYVFVRWLLPWLWPFLIAALVARLGQRPLRFLHEKCRLPRRLAACLVVIAVYCTLGALTGLALRQIAAQLRGFLTAASGYLSELPGHIAALRAGLSQVLEPLPDSMREALLSSFDRLPEQLSVSTATLTSLAARLTGMAVSLPAALLFAITTVVATYFLTAAGGQIAGALLYQLPRRWRDGLSRVLRHLLDTLGKWLRAMGILLVITFAQLFLGFYLMGVGYPGVTAALVALIDLLPVLGTGTVLIPWALLALLAANYQRALYLALLFIIITVVRAVLEPKIVGQQIGLHPLATLVCIYAGFRAMGLAGMLLFPVAAITLIQLQAWGYIKLWKTPRVQPAEGDKEEATEPMEYADAAESAESADSAEFSKQKVQTPDAPPES